MTTCSQKKACPLRLQTEGNPNKQDAEKQLTGWLKTPESRNGNMRPRIRVNLLTTQYREDFPPQHSTVHIVRTCVVMTVTRTHAATARARALSMTCETFLRTVYTLRVRRRYYFRLFLSTLCWPVDERQPSRSIDLAEWWSDLSVVPEDPAQFKYCSLSR